MTKRAVCIGLLLEVCWNLNSATKSEIFAHADIALKIDINVFWKQIMFLYVLN